jgi:hypothetical protein
MNNILKRRVLRIVPLAIAVALSTGACAALPCTAGSNGASAPISNNSATTNGGGNGGGSAIRGGSSAPGGQGGYSSGGSAGLSAGPGSGGSAGLSSGSGSGGSVIGMTPDEVAMYCTSFADIVTPEIAMGHALEVQQYQKLRKATPIQLQQNVDTIIADYQAIDTGKRIYAQLKDELLANYQPLKDFSNQICVAH